MKNIGIDNELVERINKVYPGTDIPKDAPFRVERIIERIVAEAEQKQGLAPKEEVELRKIEVEANDEGFIHADQWRELTANSIISSVDIGLSVLKEKEGFGKEYHGQLLVLIEEIAKMLAREV